MTKRYGGARLRIAGAVSIATLGLAACSSTPTATTASGTAAAVTTTVATTSAPVATTTSDAGGTTTAPAPADKVELTFWSWVGGIDKAVAAWNDTHPNVHVTLNAVPGGKQGTYPKLFAAVKAGNAPDLGQIEFDYLPNFINQDAVVDISQYVPDAKAKFPAGLWSLISPDDKAAYAIPQDAGPMALFYRKDVYAKDGITKPPATWDEFAADAKIIHDKDSSAYIANFMVGNADWLAGLVWQAGGSWFDTTADSWKVQLNSPESKKVADYWQGLIDKKQVIAQGAWNDQWKADLNDGKIVSWVSGAWGGNTLSTAKIDKTTGQWAVAPMPQWTAGGATTGNWGGSTTAVMKGSKHAKEAAEFAAWLNSDPASVAHLVNDSGLYPAASGWFDDASHDPANPFFGGQHIFGVIAKGQAPTSWRWGPTMPAVYTNLQDAMGKLPNGKLPSILDAAQSFTVDDMKKQGYSVAGG